MSIDFSTLYVFSEDARVSLPDAGKFLRKSPQRLNYSLSTIIEKNIFGLPYVLIDYSYFNLLLFRVYFKSAYIGDKDKVQILKKFNEYESIVSVYELSGEYDLVVEFMMSNPSKFNKEFKQIISEIPSLNNYKIVLNLVTHITPRDYLVPNKFHGFSKEVILGGDRELLNFDSNELLVLKALLKNPVGKMTQLSLISGLSSQTVKTVLKKLEKKRIFKGCKYIINPTFAEIYKERIFLKLHNLTFEKETEFIQFLIGVPEIVLLSKTVGDWDVEIDVEARDRAKIKILLQLIREKYKDIMMYYTIMEFVQYYKRAYLPNNVFVK